MTNYILIDGSYYIFYRYYALMMWWKNAHKDEPIDEPIEKKEFVEKYLHTFSTKINDLIKKLKIIDPSILYFKDCPREQIWRNKYISKYKGTRNYDNFKGGPFFKLTYETDILKQSGVKKLIYMDEVGTPDSSRIWDGAALRDGKVVENSKEGFRQFLLNHFDDADVLLNKQRMDERTALARDNALPLEAMQEISDTYIGIAEKIIGRKLVVSQQPKEEIIDVLNQDYGLIR